MGRKIHIPWDAEESVDIPDGTHVVVKCTSFDEGETQDGDPKLVLEFVVTSPKQYKGQKIKQNFTVPKGLRFLRPVIKALLGQDPPKRAADLDASLVEGKSCKAVVQVSGSWINLIEWEPVSKVDDGLDGDDEDLGGGSEVRTVKVGNHTIELTRESLSKYKASALVKIAKAAGVDPSNVDNDDKEALIGLILGENEEDDFNLDDGLDDEDDFPFDDEDEKPKQRARR